MQIKPAKKKKKNLKAQFYEDHVGLMQLKGN